MARSAAPAGTRGRYGGIEKPVEFAGLLTHIRKLGIAALARLVQPSLRGRRPAPGIGAIDRVGVHENASAGGLLVLAINHDRFL